jgi:hypothetical protein
VSRVDVVSVMAFAAVSTDVEKAEGTRIVNRLVIGPAQLLFFSSVVIRR